jgi:D-arabinose 1-dehydrogenase-like Zn-dependent alcohol dehydrogenase
MLKAMGHENIAVCEIDESKWQTAYDMGAIEAVDPLKEGALAKLQALQGGVWGVIDFVGAQTTDTLGIAALRKGGRYVIVGLYGGEIPMSLVPITQRAITIQGSYVGSLQELHEVVALAKSGKLKPIPIATCSMDQISEVLDRLKAGSVIGRVVCQLETLA